MDYYKFIYFDIWSGNNDKLVRESQGFFSRNKVATMLMF